jgi:hypothetical protein
MHDSMRADLVVRDPKGIHGEKFPCNSILNNKGIPSPWISLGSLSTKSALRRSKLQIGAGSPINN